MAQYWAISWRAVNRIPVIAPLLGTDFRVLFYRGVSPSKIGPIAPYWYTVHLRLNARVFLLGEKKSRLVCIAVTDSAKR
jgi:hypothetical protein